MMFLAVTSLLVFFGSIQLVTPKDSGIKKVALANNIFALKLHKSYDGQSNENVFSSPVSVFTALGMLYAGARGSTRLEMNEALSYDESGLGGARVGKHIKKFLSSLSLASDNSTLKIANALLSQHNCPVSKKYRKFIKYNFNAIERGVDFRNNAKKAVDEINEWVRSETEGKITKLIDSLDGDTVLILLNAVYFQGKWQVAFDPQFTKEGNFYNGGTEKAFVPKMMTEDDFLYGDYVEYGLKAIKLPYAGDEFSMVILLPRERNGVLRVEQNLTLAMLDDILERLAYENVLISLPKFKMEDSRELKKSLEKLGIRSAFTEMANFRAINKELPLEVSEVVHSGVVEVDEHGTEAAGATLIGIRGRSSVKTIYLDIEHPFLFLIRHDATGAILFIGRVNQLKP